MRKSLLVGSLAVCSVILFSGSVLAADNWLGTWKLNTAKSKYSPGPGPKSLTLKIEASDNVITVTTDGESADGQTTHGGYASKFDGKEVPWEGNPEADMASPKRIDANRYSNTWKKDGKATITSNAAVSKDGKTLTISQTGKNSKGETVNSALVFDRQ